MGVRAVNGAARHGMRGQYNASPLGLGVARTVDEGAAVPLCQASCATVPMKRRLRFLVVSSDKFPPFRVDVTELFGRQMAGRGHVIEWLLQSEADCAAPHEADWPGGRVWVGATDNRETRLARLRKHLRGIGNDFRLFGLMRRTRYDFVQVKDKFIAALFALLACKRHGVPMVFWLSYPFPESDLYAAREGTARYPWFYRLRGTVFKWLLYDVILRHARHCFVQSEQMKRDVAAMGVPIEKLTAVPMGLGPNLLDVELAPSSAAGATVVYLGTLARNRRLDAIVRAFRLVVDAVPEARLLFVGAGDDAHDREVLEREVERLGLREQVVFTGFLPRERALEHVARAVVCLSPFYPTPIFNSTSPTKLIEYMALGRAVVANRHPEQRELLEDSGGGLCVEWEEREFAEAIVTLLRDPARAAEMGRRGQRYIREHRSYARIADLVESRYLTICAAGSPAAISTTAE